MNFKSAIKKITRLLGIEVSTYSVDRQWLGTNSVKFNTVVDVGANNGQFLKQVLPLYQPKLIICFEPLPDCVKELNIVKSGVGVAQMEIHQVAASDNSETISFNIHDGDDTSSSILPSTSQFKEIYPNDSNIVNQEIKCARIDDRIVRDSIIPPMLVKFDCQGFDYTAMKGAVDTLSECHTCIVEYIVADLYENQSSFIDIVNLADQAGLRFVGVMEQHYKRDGSVAFVDAVFQRK